MKIVVESHDKEVVSILKDNSIRFIKMFRLFREDLETVRWWKSVELDHEFPPGLLHLRWISLFHAISESLLGGPKNKGLDQESGRGWSMIYWMAGSKGA